MSRANLSVEQRPNPQEQQRVMRTTCGAQELLRGARKRSCCYVAEALARLPKEAGVHVDLERHMPELTLFFLSFVRVAKEMRGRTLNKERTTLPTDNRYWRSDREYLLPRAPRRTSNSPTFRSVSADEFNTSTRNELTA